MRKWLYNCCKWLWLGIFTGKRGLFGFHESFVVDTDFSADSNDTKISIDRAILRKISLRILLKCGGIFHPSIPGQYLIFFRIKLNKHEGCSFRELFRVNHPVLFASDYVYWVTERHPPRFWRALMLPRAPRAACKALARRHFYSLIWRFVRLPKVSELWHYERLVINVYYWTYLKIESVF